MVDRVYELYTIQNFNIVTPYISPLEWQFIGGLYGHIVQQIFFPEYYPELPIVYPPDD
jgi:hypothetical protein